MLMLMAESKKIKDGTFVGSYTAPKKRRWGLMMIIVAVVLLVGGVAGWFVWQNEMSKRLDQDTYQSALESSEAVPYVNLDDTQRNARFQQCSGITMDAYLDKPITIDDTAKRYECTQLLDSAEHYDESLKLYKSLMEADNIGDVSIAQLLEKTLDISYFANDRQIHAQALEAYKEYLTSENFSGAEQQVLIDRYGWSSEDE